MSLNAKVSAGSCGLIRVQVGTRVVQFGQNGVFDADGNKIYQPEAEKLLGVWDWLWKTKSS
jgi:hypothetical protein